MTTDAGTDTGRDERARGLQGLLEPPDLVAAMRALGAEPKSCLLCSSSALERLFQRSGKWFWLCRGCELVFVHDIYPEFAHDTGHLDGSYEFDRLESAGAKKSKKYDEFLDPLAAHRRTNRLLEVGCGQGLFLEHARRAGWEVQGVELLPPVAERARERGLAVFTGELAAARFPDARFDVVVMREVIEHIVDPVALLREVARVLRPGGVAVLGTGNARSWAARLRGARWHYYRFGGHMHIRFYSPRSAAALARASGFAAVETRTSGFAFLEASEMRGRWYKPFLKLAQAPLSPLARGGARGHRLVITLHKADDAPSPPAPPSAGATKGLSIPATTRKVLALLADLDWRAARIADVGAGRGHFCAVLGGELAARGLEPRAHLFPCDLFPANFACAGLECAPIRPDGRLPYADASLDAVVCIEVIEHVQDQFAFLRELARIARPGARVIVTTPNVASLQSRVRNLLVGFPELFDPLPLAHPDAVFLSGHIHPIAPYYVAHAALAAGLERPSLHGDRQKRSSLFWAIALWPALALARFLQRRRLARKHPAVLAENRALLDALASLELATARTAILCARKPESAPR